MARYFVTCVPGAEAIVIDEIKERLGGSVGELRSGRGKIFFASSDLGEKLNEIRCADNVYEVLGAFDVGGTKADLQQISANISRISREKLLKFSGKMIVSASRSGKHSYSRFDISQAAEKAIASVTGMAAGTAEAHDHALRLDVKDGGCVFSLQLTRADFRFRGGSFVTAPGGIRPTVAHCLVRLSAPKGGDVMYDPFCGAGTIPFERAYYAHRRIFASDISAEAVAAAKSNLGGNAVVFQADATSTAMKPESVDAIISNIPWGKQIVVGDISALYEGFLAEVGRILRPGGRAILLTDQHDSLRTACEKRGFSCEEAARFSLHGLMPSVFRLKRHL